MNFAEAVIFLAICAVLVVVAMNPAPKRGAQEAEVRRVAVEEACRTIVEAGLVRSCSRNSLQSK